MIKTPFENLSEFRRMASNGSGPSSCLPIAAVSKATSHRAVVCGGGAMKVKHKRTVTLNIYHLPDSPDLDGIGMGMYHSGTEIDGRE